MLDWVMSIKSKDEDSTLNEFNDLMSDMYDVRHETGGKLSVLQV